LPWEAAAFGVALVLAAGAFAVWKYRHPRILLPSSAPQTIAALPIPSVEQFPSLTPEEIPLPGGKAIGAKAGGKTQALPGGAVAGRSASRRALSPGAGKPGAPPPASATATQPAQAPAASANTALTPAPASGTLSTAAGKPVASASRIQFLCRHELKEGKLTVTAGGQEILQAPLKGKKKGGFIGIKGGYEGFLSRSLTVPPGARDLAVHVSSSDGAIDLSQPISLPPPAGSSPVLEVIVKRDGIQLNWRAPAASK